MSLLSDMARRQFFRLQRKAPKASALLFVPRAIAMGLRIGIDRGHIDISSRNRSIRLSHKQQIYVSDIIDNFDFYHAAVKSIAVHGQDVVDYSTPRHHEVVGYDLHPILFPSLAEPIATAEQYLAFGQLKQGDIVLDLGAYSGLTSILFDQTVAPSGRVIAVEADSQNVACLRQNVLLYQGITWREIVVQHGAVWERDGELAFSSEGNMGSSAAAIVGAGRGHVVQTPSFTLNALAERYCLDRVDFIKCDIEGAEAVIFRQPEFFYRFKPRMIIEVHRIHGELTTGACRHALGQYGYKCREVDQAGSDLPLLECVP